MKAWIYLLIPLLLPVAFSCTGEDPHMKKAKGLERSIIRKYTEVDYSMKDYLKVAKELNRVSPLSKDYPEARRLLKEIGKARLMALHRDGERVYLPEDVRKRVMEEEMGEPMPGKREGKGKKEPGGEGGGKDLPAKGGPVILYATKWCPYCEKVRQYFREKGIPFEEKDVEKSPAAMREMQRKTGYGAGVPVIDFRGEIVIGFDEERLDRLLQGKGGG